MSCQVSADSGAAAATQFQALGTQTARRGMAMSAARYGAARSVLPVWDRCYGLGFLLT